MSILVISMIQEGIFLRYKSVFAAINEMRTYQNVQQFPFLRGEECWFITLISDKLIFSNNKIKEALNTIVYIVAAHIT